MKKTTSVRLQFKGIDILTSTEQDLSSFSSQLLLKYESVDLDHVLTGPTKVDTDGLTEAQVTAAKKQFKKDQANCELILMQHLGGEVKTLLLRKLHTLRFEKPKNTASGLQAWLALKEIFTGVGSSQKHLYLSKMFMFKFQQPATKKSLMEGLQAFETIHAKLQELDVKFEEDVLSIKLASALPKGNTACHIVYTNTMQRISPTFSTVVSDIEQLISQFECDEYSMDDQEHGLNVVDGKDDDSWCNYCKTIGDKHTNPRCFNHPKHPRNKNGKGGKSSSSDKKIQATVDKAIKAYDAAQKNKKTQKRTCSAQICSPLANCNNEI